MRKGAWTDTAYVSTFAARGRMAGAARRNYSVMPAETKRRYRMPLPATHFSPRSIGVLPCRERRSTWPRLLQYSK